MCFLRPLKIKSIKDKSVTLENGLVAYYDKSVGKISVGDPVIVYGNVIIQKADEYEVPPNE